MDCSGFEDSQPSKAPFVFSRARFLRRARKYCSMSNAAAPHRYDTIAMLDRAKQMSGGQVNWITGVVHSELPGFFRLRKVAEAELAWCFDKCPQSVPCRLVARSRPPRKAGARKGGTREGGRVPAKERYKDWNRPATLITPVSEDAATGQTFAPRRVAAIVPGRVYVLTGFEFTECYFVVSDDRRELIGIDVDAVIRLSVSPHN